MRKSRELVIRLASIRKVLVLSAALTVLIESAAHATAGGVPTLLIVVPASWALFLLALPVKLVLTQLCLKKGWWNSVKISLPTSAISTLVGIPITHIVVTIVSMMLFDLNVLTGDGFVSTILGGVIYIPIEGDMGPAWGPYGTLAFMCIPCFLMSAWWEERMLHSRLPEIDRAPIRDWARTSNGFVYGMAFLVLLMIALSTGH